jgi:IclR family KDG regulon transcriptional repressor
MKINSVERCIRIIEVLSEHPQGLKLTELSAKLDLHPSSVHHIIRTLYPYDYIAQDADTKKYSLGLRFLEISRRITDNIDIRTIARRHLEELRRRIQETVHLAVLRGGKVVYIDKIDHPGGLSLATYVGFATDPHAAAGGKVLLAGLAAEEVKEIYRNRQLKSYGKKTITRLSVLLKELEDVRIRGYAVDDEEYYEGIRCVAAPIRSGGQVLAAVSVTGSIFSITPERMQGELVALVKSTADKISAELKW